MEEYIHRKTLALFKKRLTEISGGSGRKALSKLPAQEESKNTLPSRRPKP
jgi:hypothetical protein